MSPQGNVPASSLPHDPSGSPERTRKEVGKIQEKRDSERGCAYSFLDFALDPATERLVHGTQVIRLRPKSFQVMRYLVEHAGRLVTREELLQAVWGDVAVTDESVTKCIADIRKALEDSQDIIQTVPRRGFLFQPLVRLAQLGEAC